MVLDNILGKKDKLSDESSDVIGMLHSKNNEEFMVEELIQRQSKYLSKLYKTINDKPERKIIISNNGGIIPPYEIVKIPLDLSRSSDKTNENLLEYLGYGTLVNQLICNSSLDATSILYIMNNPKYQNEQTLSYLSIYQDLFVSDKCISLLPFICKIRLYTKNINRTQEIMDARKPEFNALIKKLLKNYLTHEEDLVSENPSDIRVDIIRTCNTFYAKDISFADIKNELIKIPEKELASTEIDIRAIKAAEKLLTSAISDSRITEEDLELYKRAKIINSSMKNESIRKAESIRTMITTLKNFPN